MTYAEVIDYLFAQLPMFHRIGPAAYKPSLSNTLGLMEIVGHPERRIRTVHVAGTNGKGSVSHLIASVLQEAGYKTGLCTSPHLIDFRERIRINGIMIPEDAVIAFVETYRDQWAEIQPSFFEMSIALAFWYFDREQTDIAVIETGLGGRLDSTNVILPEVSVITNIGFDHMNLLGDTLEKIAAEKAGIVKAGIPVVVGPMREEARNVITRAAENQMSPIHYTTLQDPAPPTALSGTYQEENRRTAARALEVLQASGDWKISKEHIVRGFINVVHNTRLMGRWQKIHDRPVAIADVAHNEDGIRMVIGQLADLPHKTLHFVLGMVSDKDVERVLRLLPASATYYFCKANIPRGMDAAELREQASSFGLHGQHYPSVRQAYEAALSSADTEDLVFVGGSVFTVAEVLPVIE